MFKTFKQKLINFVVKQSVNDSVELIHNHVTDNMSRPAQILAINHKMLRSALDAKIRPQAESASLLSLLFRFNYEFHIEPEEYIHSLYLVKES